MTGDFDFHLDDEVVDADDPVAYRIVLDLSSADAELLDKIAGREGLQPTQILTAALQAYARTAVRNPPDVQAFGRLSVALHRNLVPPARRRKVA